MHPVNYLGRQFCLGGRGGSAPGRPASPGRMAAAGRPGRDFPKNLFAPGGPKRYNSQEVNTGADALLAFSSSRGVHDGILLPGPPPADRSVADARGLEFAAGRARSAVRPTAAPSPDDCVSHRSSPGGGRGELEPSAAPRTRCPCNLARRPDEDPEAARIHRFGPDYPASGCRARIIQR